MYKSAASLYSEFETDRHSYLLRARDCSRLTLPMLLPDEGTTHSTHFPTPFQGLGARGVNHLAASLLMSLLPPNQPFFRLALDEEAIRALGGVEEYKTEIDQSLASIERAVMQEIEVKAIRSAVFEALKHLIVTGNALVYLGEDGIRVFRLNHYVVKRDPTGKILHIVVKETVSPLGVPDEAKPLVQQKSATENSVDMYTCVHAIENNKYEAYQVIENTILESTRGTYREDSMPWLALRMNRVDGESYGRGYVEEYLGDLRSLEGLTQAIVEGSAAASKVLFLVNPNGMTRADVLSKSPNGAIREGMAADVSVLQVQKQADFGVALQAVATIRDRLNYAFLLAESTIRNAERVTAEEVRLTTAAVERQLGGIYSILAQEFQLPLVNRFMDVMSRRKRLPKVPKEFVKPMIITGVDALGRGNDLVKLDALLAGMAQIFGPQAIAQFVNPQEYLARRAAALGIDTKGLIKSPEEMAAEANKAMMANMTEKLGPSIVGQYGKMVETGALPAPGQAQQPMMGQ
jgi:hypothetical protein